MIIFELKCLFFHQQGEIIGQFNHGFIITRLLDNDLFIVDQHATDEKFRYEEFLNNSKIVSQPLVCAQSLDLDPGKKEILKENLAVLEELGFGIEVADNIKVKLTKVPHCDRIVLGKYLLNSKGIS
jgi:DNA mismatch repair protein PMS2